MKIKQLIIAFACLTLFACSKKPEANFEHRSESYLPNETVFFINTSENANNFEWDFGDGNVSTKRNPEHKYEEFGNYQVSLRAFGENAEQEDIIERRISIVRGSIKHVLIHFINVEYFPEKKMNGEDWDDVGDSRPDLYPEISNPFELVYESVFYESNADYNKAYLFELRNPVIIYEPELLHFIKLYDYDIDLPYDDVVGELEFTPLELLQDETPKRITLESFNLKLTLDLSYTYHE